MEYKFTLLILAYNDGKTIEKCLDSLKSQDIFQKNIPFEIITLPNGCTDNTEEKILNFFDSNTLPHVDFRNISIKEGHRNKALNRGILESKSDLVMYLNADCTISKSVLSEIYTIFESSRQLKLAGVDDVPVSEGISKDTILYKMFEGESVLSKIRKKKLPIGRFIAFKKGLFDKFPEDIHSEDIWLGLTCVKSFGLESVAVLMDQSVYWEPPINWAEYIKLYTRYEQGTAQMLQKYPDLKPTFNALTLKSTEDQKQELAKRVMAELSKIGYSEKDAYEYIQIYKILREVIAENVKLTTENYIGDNGTWVTDR